MMIIPQRRRRRDTPLLSRWIVTTFAASIVLVSGCSRDRTSAGSPSTSPADSPEVAAEPSPASTDSDSEDAASTPPESTVGESAGEPLLVADDFLFQLSETHGAVLGDEVTIRADGRMVWLAMRQDASGFHRPHIVELRLEDVELRAFRQALVSARFFEIPAESRDPSVSDGTQVFMRARAGGRAHRVSCDNEYPPSVESIRTALRALTTDERRQRFAGARAARPEEIDSELTRPLAP